MRTVNISLTDYQTKEIDQAVGKLGFANRSEFFRTLLRVFLKRPEVIYTEEEWLMRSPDTKSAQKVFDSFKTSGKYSRAFLNDLVQGLKDSDYFTDDLPK